MWNVQVQIQIILESVCVWKDLVMYSKWCWILGDWSEHYVGVYAMFRM